MAKSEKNRHPKKVGTGLGRLKFGNPSGDFTKAPRCGAKTRRGTSCQCPAMKNGRCRLHGGLSTGPKTPEGIERIRRAVTKHGRYANQVRRPRRKLRVEPTKRGRKRVEMDPTIVFELAAMGCTDREIAAHFNVTPDTIARRKREKQRLPYTFKLNGRVQYAEGTFAEIIRRGAAFLQITLRQLQFEAALGGDVRLLIRLGKERLGQSNGSNPRITEIRLANLEKAREAKKKKAEGRAGLEPQPAEGVTRPKPVRFRKVVLGRLPKGP
jgi:hypothetical protein